MLRAALKQQWIGDKGLLDYLEREEDPVPNRRQRQLKEK